MQPLPDSSAYRPAPRRTRWLLLACIATAGLATWGFYHKKQLDISAKRQPVPIAVTLATHQAIPIYFTGLGTVQAYQTVTVHSRMDGQLMALKFREGQTVKEGDVLAELDARTLKAQLNQALAAKAKNASLLANARADLARYAGIGEAVSRQTRDTAAASVRQLEATVQGDDAAIESARAQLSYATITAPITGRTGLRQVDVGNIIHAGDSNGIVTITQLEPISVMFSLPQQHLEVINTTLNAGQKLTVEALTSDQGEVIDTGTLDLVDNQIDQTTGSIRLRATFPNHAQRLWPGGFANVRLLVTTHPEALTIPTVAIQRGPDGAYVFVYQPPSDPSPKATGTVRMQKVTLGATHGDDSEILSGLKPEDAVVTDGMAKLQDQSNVTLAAPPAAAPQPAAHDGA